MEPERHTSGNAASRATELCSAAAASRYGTAELCGASTAKLHLGSPADGATQHYSSAPEFRRALPARRRGSPRTVVAHLVASATRGQVSNGLPRLPAAVRRLTGLDADGCGPGDLPAGILFDGHFVGKVILVDVADVVRSLGADAARGNEFDIVE